MSRGNPPDRAHPQQLFRPTYTAIAVTSICALSYLDRDLIVLLLQPIKVDLRLSDTQIGSVTGIAFGLLYSIAGLPIARWADRGNRITIASLAVLIWSISAALYPAISGFWSLWSLRLIAAISEAGCLPTAYSLLGDYFVDPAKRLRAMTFYWLTGPIAALLSFGPGAYAAETFGWRAVFLMLALPALILATLIKVTLREPRSSMLPSEPALPASRELVNLWRRPASRNLIIGVIVSFSAGYGLSPWYGAFMMRMHAMSIKDIGTCFALIFGLGGIAGTLSGGYLAARFFAGDERSQLRLGAVFLAALFPCFLLFLFAQSRFLALVALIPIATAATVFLAPSFSILLRLVQPRARATVLATLMLGANVLGMGLIPFLIGALSDALSARLGDQSLRYSMAIMSVLCAIAGLYVWRAGRFVQADLKTMPDSTNETA